MASESKKSALLMAVDQHAASTLPSPPTTTTKRNVTFADEICSASSRNDPAGASKEPSGVRRKRRLVRGPVVIRDVNPPTIHREVDHGLYKDEDDREALSRLTEFKRESILAERAALKSDQDLADRFNIGKSKIETRTTTPTPERASALADLAKRRREQANKKPSFISSPPPTFSSGGLGGSLPSIDELCLSPDMATYEDMLEITIQRGQLLEWYLEPFFEELIPGCFVRLYIGHIYETAVYRLCSVLNVDATNPHKTYRLEPNKETAKYLNLAWGNEDSTARWQMRYVSDFQLTKREFIEWAVEVKRFMGYWPSKRDVRRKMEEFRKVTLLLHPPAPIVEPIVPGFEDYKRKKVATPLLEGPPGFTARNEKGIKLAEMNRKNKIENFQSASQNKRMYDNLKAGDDGYDPLSRRWTRPSSYGYNSRANECTSTALNKGKAIADEEEEAAAEGKLVDTDAPVDKRDSDLRELHDFELPISLEELEKYGGSRGARAGYLANKQRVERNVGVKVPENDGRAHDKAMSIEEYMRRRGLL